MDMTRGNPLPILARFAIPLIPGFTIGSAIGFLFPRPVSAGDAEEVSRNFRNGLYLSLGIGLCAYYIPKAGKKFAQSERMIL